MLSAKTLGELVGLCKETYSEGKARKVIGCSCVVVKNLWVLLKLSYSLKVRKKMLREEDGMQLKEIENLFGPFSLPSLFPFPNLAKRKIKFFQRNNKAEKKKMAISNGCKKDILRGRCRRGWTQRCWALILVRILVEELLQTIPLICKSWWSAATGPYCLSNINVEDWCHHWNRLDRVDSLVCKLVHRSRGTCRWLSTYRLGDRDFAFAANWVRCLKVL